MNWNCTVVIEYTILVFNVLVYLCCLIFYNNVRCLESHKCCCCRALSHGTDELSGSCWNRQSGGGWRSCVRRYWIKKYWLKPRKRYKCEIGNPKMLACALGRRIEFGTNKNSCWCCCCRASPRSSGDWVWRPGPNCIDQEGNIRSPLQGHLLLFLLLQSLQSQFLSSTGS